MLSWLLLLLLGEGAVYSNAAAAYTHSIPAHEYAALQDLYCGTGGEAWQYNYMQGVKWDFGSAPCSGGNGTGSGDPCVDNWCVHNHSTYTAHTHNILKTISSIICHHHLLGTE
jgi:hypothetical protein